jgi:hypothetical protein
VRTLAALALALALAPLAGCGYSTGIPVTERLGTVGVTVFGNETMERDVERPMQDQVTEALRSYTDAVLADPHRADVLIRGTVTQFHRRSGIRSPDNVLLETGLYVEVEATLVDRRSDLALGPPKRAGTWVGYILDDPRNELEARARAYRSVAEKLVLDLFSPLE